jgi:hypothetical protein
MGPQHQPAYPGVAADAAKAVARTQQTTALYKEERMAVSPYPGDTRPVLIVVNRFDNDFASICFKMNRNPGPCQEFDGGNLNGRRGARDFLIATAWRPGKTVKLAIAD